MLRGRHLYVGAIPSNTIIPSASVKVTSLSTGVEQTGPVTGDGIYLVVNLTPGQYVVEVSASGFQTFAQTVLLETGQRARLDVTLPVGALGETVTVEGVAPLLDTQSAVLGNVVSQNEVSNLPRDPQLGRSPLHPPRRAGRSLHRTDRHHERRPHRWRQCAWEPVPAAGDPRVMQFSLRVQF